MAGMLIVVGVMLTIYGVGRNEVPFIIGGIVLFILGMLLISRKRPRRRRGDGGSGDTISYESHHDSHDSGSDSGGDGGGGGD